MLCHASKIRYSSWHMQRRPFVHTHVDHCWFVSWSDCTLSLLAGNYQTMIANCEDSDGQSRCFYKGWADDADATVHAYDLPGWQQLMDPCYADSMECSDAVQAVTVTGHGAPMHQKWFWSSRKVYLQLEPAWYLVMSGSKWRGGCRICIFAPVRLHSLKHMGLKTAILFCCPNGLVNASQQPDSLLLNASGQSDALKLDHAWACVINTATSPACFLLFCSTATARYQSSSAAAEPRLLHSHLGSC